MWSMLPWHGPLVSGLDVAAISLPWLAASAPTLRGVGAVVLVGCLVIALAYLQALVSLCCFVSAPASLLPGHSRGCARRPLPWRDDVGVGARLGATLTRSPSRRRSTFAAGDYFLSGAGSAFFIISAQVLCIFSISAALSGLPLGQVGAPVLSRP